jgi:hypothetical protein
MGEDADKEPEGEHAPTGPRGTLLSDQESLPKTQVEEEGRQHKGGAPGGPKRDLVKRRTRQEQNARPGRHESVVKEPDPELENEVSDGRVDGEDYCVIRPGPKPERRPQEAIEGATYGDVVVANRRAHGPPKPVACLVNHLPVVGEQLAANRSAIEAGHEDRLDQ